MKSLATILCAVHHGPILSKYYYIYYSKQDEIDLKLMFEQAGLVQIKKQKW